MDSCCQDSSLRTMLKLGQNSLLNIHSDEKRVR